MNYILKVDDDYLIGFEGEPEGKTSHNGWNQHFTEMGTIQLSQYMQDAYVFEGRINMKSALDKVYDRLRFTSFKFDKLEVISIPYKVVNNKMKIK